MEQSNLNVTQTTKDKLPNGLQGLIESLSVHIPALANPTASHSLTNHTPATDGQLPLSAVPANEVSRLSENSGDSSINSIGYAADISELQQPTNTESPAKVDSNNHTTPLTPTANLKMLVAAASSALDRERRDTNEDARKSVTEDGDDSSSSRKMKSLALLCKRFLQVADEEIGAGKEFSLEMMASSLGINRRRIYDIINVMEALEMISKQSKNWYLWHGRENLLMTLAKLKAMVAEDPDIAPYLESTSTAAKAKDTPGQKQAVSKPESVSSVEEQETESSNQPTSEVTEEDDDQAHYNPNDYPFAARSVRYDKSLGVLCQKFVMLFLISQDNEVTLEEAGKILVPDYQDDTIYMTLNPPVNPKTKVRRLYDIANILTSLGLIEKKVFVGPLHIKKPGYCWSGPSIEEIDRTWSSKKQDSSKPVSSKMKKSISCRPFLHHFDAQSDVSPYCSPVKALGGSKFKRSLSFGGTSTATSTPRSSKMCSTPPIPARHPTVLARPLCPKQVDYLREMREFESEMNKHAHRYPHVASIFHEFLQKYQSTLEQTAAANGRFILPKAAAGMPQNSVTQSTQDVVHSLQQGKSDFPPPCVGCGSTWDHSMITDHSDIKGQQVGQTIEVGQATQQHESVTYAMPSNTFVASLANSILANILGTIQNTAVTDSTQAQQPQIPSPPATMACNNFPPNATTEITTTSNTDNSIDSSTTVPSVASNIVLPLTEVQNIQDNKETAVATTALSPATTNVPPTQKGFVHVDELLVKPGSRVRPGNSGMVFGSLSCQKPAMSQNSASVNCIPIANKNIGVNPNTFLLPSDDLVADKENVMPYRCDTTLVKGEKSPKRQRIC